MATLRRSLLLTLGMSVVLGCVVGVLFTIGRHDADAEAVAVAIGVSMLYSISIGVPAMLVLRRLQGWIFRKRGLRAWFLYAGVLAAITAAGILATRLVLTAAGLMTLDEMWGGYVQGLQIAVAIGVPCTIAVISFSRLHERLGHSERERQRSLGVASDARLASLESRVRPHFLFNALNSAIGLIPEDPRRAEDVLVRLSALLRFSLDAHARVVPLGEELRVVVDYLEIERVRFGDRLAYDVDVPDDLRALEVPVFAVQTLVENCVKYAVSTRKQGARIAVRAHRAGRRLVLDVSDDGPGFGGEVWLPGHGLDGLRARLDALYGAGASLEAPMPIASGTGAAVRIALPAGAP
jgi:Histidine kinase